MSIDVAALDRNASPLTVARGLGLAVVRACRDGVIVPCPAHEEGTPGACSIVRREGRILWHCFGCEAGGDLISLVATVRSIDPRGPGFRVAAAATADLLGATMTETDTRPAPRSAPVRPVPPARRPLDLDALGSVLLTLDSPHASSVAGYTRGRGLLAEATADDWRALDAPEAAHVADERVALGGDPMADPIGRAGLVALRDDGHRIEWATHVLVIPWRNPRGEVDLIQRRRIDGQAAHKYVFPTGQRPAWPYGVELVARAPGAELVIVEGAIDTLARRALDDAGRVVIGIPGTSGWRAEWAELARGRVVRVALDADPAGDKAADAMVPGLFAAGATRVIRSRPVGGDWAEQIAATRAA